MPAGCIAILRIAAIRGFKTFGCGSIKTSSGSLETTGRPALCLKLYDPVCVSFLIKYILTFTEYFLSIEKRLFYRPKTKLLIDALIVLEIMFPRLNKDHADVL